MNVEQKLVLIEDICTQTSGLIGQLLEFASDTDPEVRYRAIECFELAAVTDVIAIIRKGLQDPDEIVCTTCLEILGDMEDDRSINAILPLLSSESSLVRGEAAIALGNIGRTSVIGNLLSQLGVENNDEVKVAIYAALYDLGKESCLDDLLNELNNKYYRVRCASANLLATAANSKNREVILRHLYEALTREDTVAAKSSIENAISVINEE